MALLVGVVAGGGSGALVAGLTTPGSSSSSGIKVVRTSAASTTSATAASSVQAVVASVEPAVVNIHTDSGAGTGMIIRSDGLVLTNAHVVSGASSITVTLNGQTTTHPATLVGANTSADVALIKIQGLSNLPTVTLKATAPQVGDTVIAIGNALDLQGGFTVTEGIISALNRTVPTDTGQLTGLLQTDAAISSGNSGGPLVDTSGNVIGMNTATAASSSRTSAQNIGFALSINQILPIINQLQSQSPTQALG
jgi:putative serine protease PepD